MIQDGAFNLVRAEVVSLRKAIANAHANTADLRARTKAAEAEAERLRAEVAQLRSELSEAVAKRDRYHDVIAEWLGKP